MSMAGLAETVSVCAALKILPTAVRTVWASIASGRALAYLSQNGVKDVGMGVVIQPMVPAIAAGVMFTRRPKGPGTSA